MHQATMRQISHEDYINEELISDIRHEYYDGQVVAMAGAGEKHNIIAGNIFASLRQKSRGTPCRAFITDMKLYLASLNRYYYPDIMLTCNPDDNQEYYKEQPCLLIEVLSPSTEGIDRREKLHAYQQIPSLQEYVLISQDKQTIELYRRTYDHWTYFLLNEPEDVLQLACLEISFDMQTVYEDIIFDR